MTDQRAGAVPAARACAVGIAVGISVAVVSMAAMLFGILVLVGRGLTFQPIDTVVRARLDALLILMAAAVVGFDLTVVIGTHRRLRLAIPVAAICLLIAGVSGWIVAKTPD